MSSNLIRTEVDPLTKILTEYWYDETTEELTIRKFQDMETILDVNKELYNGFNRPNYSDTDGIHLVARIPFVVLEKWQEMGFDWFKSTDNERRAWLDKPENEFLKVRPGKLGGVMKRPLTSKVS